jgi:hypothetical protein
MSPEVIQKCDICHVRISAGKHGYHEVEFDREITYFGLGGVTERRKDVVLCPRCSSNLELLIEHGLPDQIAQKTAIRDLEHNLDWAETRLKMVLEAANKKDPMKR